MRMCNKRGCDSQVGGFEWRISRDAMKSDNC